MNRRAFLAGAVAVPLAPHAAAAAPIRDLTEAAVEEMALALRAATSGFSTGALVTGYARFAVCAADWRGIYGSHGA